MLGGGAGEVKGTLEGTMSETILLQQRERGPELLHTLPHVIRQEHSTGNEGHPLRGHLGVRIALCEKLLGRPSWDAALPGLPGTQGWGGGRKGMGMGSGLPMA